MNILLLTTHLNTGGITSYLYNLTKGLRDRGVEVHVASSGGNREADFEALGARIFTLNIRTKSDISWRIYAALPRLRRYVMQHAIDIVHTQTRITQVMGQLLKRTIPIAHVSTCHGFFKTRLSRKIFPCWGDKVFAISPAVTGHLRDDFHVPAQNIVSVKSGIDLQMFAPVDEIVKNERRVARGLQAGPLAGIIARLSDVKGQDVLIEAMAQVVKSVPEAKLLIVGEGKMEGLLKQMVAQLYLEKHVIFLPTVNKPAEILSLLDVFVMPSRQEGLGLSVIEAQAAGLPVVASRVGGIPGLIEHGKTGFLVDPENPTVLAKTIVQAFQDKESVKIIGLAARDFVREAYSLEGMINEMWPVYEEMCS